MRENKLRKILVSYERRRDKAESDLEDRIKDVYNQIPEIENIDKEIALIGLNSMKKVLLNPSCKDEITKESELKINELKRRKDMLLKMYGVPDGYLKAQYSCDICKDRGFLKNGEKCSCLKREIIDEAYEMSNLSRMLSKENFSTLDISIFSNETIEEEGVSPYENMLEIISFSESFLLNFDKDNDENLLFYGNTGLGKTFMCNCIAKELLDKGYTVIYQTAFKMFEIIEDYKFKKTGEHINRDNYEALFSCDLLIIDDLGTELINSFTNGELFNILNTRIMSGKKTLISTNLHPKKLGNDYSQRIFSRVFDKFRMIKFIGKDLRWE